ncbi:DUF6053 domain-containing protein [Lysobacter enzymogenes]|uniref:DUF6053 domain-containing protein n=1 Tax=Lysobacter enzymogenes TaxID=69 RepID=UPI003D2F7C3F
MWEGLQPRRCSIGSPWWLRRIGAKSVGPEGPPTKALVGFVCCCCGRGFSPDAVRSVRLVGFVASEPKASGLKALPQKRSRASSAVAVGGASAPTLFDRFAP